MARGPSSVLNMGLSERDICALRSLKSSHDLGYVEGVIMPPKYVHIFILEPLEGVLQLL